MHAGGIEIRPSFLAAVGAERRDVGAITLGARCRRAGIDLRRQTRENDKTRGGDRGDSDSGSGPSPVRDRQQFERIRSWTQLLGIGGVYAWRGHFSLLQITNRMLGDKLLISFVDF